MVHGLDYVHVKFSVSKKDYCKTEQNKNICINLFSYADDMAYFVHVSDKAFEDSMDLLLITDENKSHYVYIKVLIELCAIRQKTKIKNTFADFVTMFENKW